MLRFFSAVSLFLLLAGGAARVALAADGGIAAARVRGMLVIGMPQPEPAYVAGAKFRTPERPEPLLADDLAARLRLNPASVRVDGGSAARWLASARADVVLAAVGEGAAGSSDIVLVPTGYSAGAMAILRSDTDIRSWSQLKGRTVCLSAGGAYVGKIAATYGAIEKVQRAPADSLLALRTGICDAAVHDDAMLNELLKLPEWKKFSARLPVQSRQALMFAVRADDADSIAVLKQVSADWAAKAYWPALKKKWANNVAFEVYLDQNVPDCH